MTRRIRSCILLRLLTLTTMSEKEMTESPENQRNETIFSEYFLNSRLRGQIQVITEKEFDRARFSALLLSHEFGTIALS